MEIEYSADEGSSFSFEDDLNVSETVEITPESWSPVEDTPVEETPVEDTPEFLSVSTGYQFSVRTNFVWAAICELGYHIHVMLYYTRLRIASLFFFISGTTKFILEIYRERSSLEAVL